MTNKYFSLLPKVIVIAVLSIAVSCNSSDSVDDNDAKGDSSSMTDTTRTATSNQANDAESALTVPGFIKENIKDNMMEIHMAKMGRDKGTDDELKKVATQLVDDHTQMLNDLKSMAIKKGVPGADQPVDMSSMPTLSDVSGRQFDMIWVGQMRVMHESKIEELQNFINNTQDADLKALATATLPKIKMHRDNLAKLRSGAQ